MSSLQPAKSLNNLKKNYNKIPNKINKTNLILESKATKYLFQDKNYPFLRRNSIKRSKSPNSPKLETF